MRALFFHFLCNHLIIKDAFLCVFYTVGLIHDVFITCYFTAYKVTIFLGYNQKNSKKIAIFSLEDGTMCLSCAWR
jgi:hypothetical protein